MKKRLSLLMVLMMVLSLVPMSAFATAGTVPGGVISVDDTDVSTDATAEKVSVKLTQAAGTELTTPAKAKLTLNKGEFKATGATAGYAADVKAMVNGVLTSVGTVEPLTGFPEVAYLTLTGVPSGTLGDDLDLFVSFELKVNEESVGDITLTVEEVDDSNIDVSKAIVIGVVEESVAGDMKVSVKDSETKIGMENNQELSQFTISDIDENNTVTTTIDKLVVELDDSLEWNAATTVAIGSLSGTVAQLAEVSINSTDKNLLEITLTPAQTEQNIIVKPFIDADARDVEKGDVVVDIIAMDGNRNIETIDATIGQIVDYDVTMTAVEKGEKVIPSLYGGEEADVKVTLSGVTGSFTTGRTIDFTVEGADVTTASIEAISGNGVVFKSLDRDGSYADDGEFALSVVGTPDELEFTIKIKTDVAMDGAVTITAQSRDFDDLECDIAEVTPAYTVEVAKVTEIKKGESLATADIVIKEAKAGMFERGEFIVLSLNDNFSDGLAFGSDYELAFTNNLDADDDLVNTDGGTRGDKNTIVLEITDASRKEAGTITISDVLVNVSGSEVDGVKALETYLVDAANFDAAMTATTAEEEDADYAVDYVNVVKEYGVTATTTVFVIGSKTYTVNGVEMTANEAPFVAGKGYTMLPVRALAESLGLSATWNSNTKTATFSNDSKVASVTMGADTMYVNGTPIPLNAKAEIKNGSTFVELRSLASAFGVELQWDAATKTVTVIG